MYSKTEILKFTDNILNAYLFPSIYDYYIYYNAYLFSNVCPVPLQCVLLPEEYNQATVMKK
jgi:hypothetical protein